MIVKKAKFALTLYLLASIPFFFLVAIPVLHGQLNFQFYLDSPTYHAAADRLDVGLGLIALTSNFFGPVLIIKLLQNSYFLIYLFNVSLFLLTCRIAWRAFPVDRLRFILILCAVPLTFTSLFSVNKEIVVVFATVLFAASYATDRPLWRWFAVAFAMLARWQMVLALLVAAVALSPVNPFRRRRLLTLVLLVGGISIFYPLNLSLFTELDRFAELGATADDGSALFPRLIQMQNQLGGYLLVFLPKATHLFVGMIRRTAHLFGGGDVMNDTILPIQSGVQLLMLAWMAWTRRLRLSSNTVYIAAIVAAIIALTPIFSTRYLLPVTVLFAIELALPRERVSASAAPSEAA